MRPYILAIGGVLNTQSRSIRCQSPDLPDRHPHLAITNSRALFSYANH